MALNSNICNKKYKTPLSYCPLIIPWKWNQYPVSLLCITGPAEPGMLPDSIICKAHFLTYFNLYWNITLSERPPSPDILYQLAPLTQVLLSPFPCLILYQQLKHYQVIHLSNFSIWCFLPPTYRSVKPIRRAIVVWFTVNLQSLRECLT